MRKLIAKALATSLVVPSLVLANAPDWTDNLEIVLSPGSVSENFSGLNFYLGDVNDVTSAQARLRKKRAPLTSNYTVEFTIANRNATFCGGGAFTSTFSHISTGIFAASMSSDGRNVFYSGRASGLGGYQANYSASIDCGQTYIPLTLPGVGVHTDIGRSGVEAIREFDESSNGHIVYDQASNSAY
jgi:hypothetical protein